MLKTLIKILKYFIAEVSIIFCFILLINNYIGNVDKTMNADGIGYYDYLPSIFIHHDFIRKDSPSQEDSTLYNRINSLFFYVDYDDFKVNKYPCGTALLEFPFFAFTYSTFEFSGDDNDGYQLPFQKSIFYAAIFYLFLSLLFFKKILVLYQVKKHVIIFCQLVLVLSTSVTHYANADAGFSHIYSLFAITAFIYFIKSFLRDKKTSHFVLASLLLGLVFILRQPNILIVLFIPFLAGSAENMRIGIRNLFTKKKSLMLGIVSFLAVTSIQSIIWYLQTGQFFVYSYQGESFNFLDPHFYSILFSYKKGLFIYTPILLFTLISIIWFAYKEYYYSLFTWVSFFLILTFVLSSWWSWYYGCSYGLRAYIDFYTVFFIPIALMLNNINKYISILMMLLGFSTIPLNIVQTYQYKEFILHWMEMDKEKYWKVFMKTDDKYRGLVWKKDFDSNQYSSVDEIIIGDISSPLDFNANVLSISSLEIHQFDKVSVIQVLIDNKYPENSDTRIALSIKTPRNDTIYYWHETYLIQFHEQNFNELHTGFYNFEFNPIDDSQEKTITLEVKTGNQSEYLQNVRVKFLSKNISSNK